MSRLSGGWTEQVGLYDTDRLARSEAVLEEAERHGLHTIRIAFADQHGVLRGKALTLPALAGAFRSGVAMTSTLLLKDPSGKTVFPVWQGGAGIGGGALDGAGDVLMIPDPESFRLVPWSEGTGWMIADLADKHGQPLAFCPRSMLRRALGHLVADGYEATFGLEVEFHIHRITDPHLDHSDAGMPGTPPETQLVGHGYQYLTEHRYDVVEEPLQAIRRNAEALGLAVRSMEIEYGPSQVEMTFAPADPMTQAEAMILFRWAARETCRRMGLVASFMCRPATHGAVSSGWHLHQSLSDITKGQNRFMPEGDDLTPEASGWIAGLLDRAAESCLLSTPTVNGYKRYQPFQLAPDRIQWGRDNKGAMIRGLMKPGDPASRIENRVAEPAASPFLYFAAQIEAGRDGMARGATAPPPVEDPYGSDAPRLPTDLGTAIEAFEGSDFWRETWGDETVRWLTTVKRAEWERYRATVTAWEQREYYTLF